MSADSTAKISALGPIMVDVAGHALTDDDREVLAHPLTGGVILFTRNYRDPQQLAALIDQIRDVRTPRLIVAVDQEGGRVQRFREGFTRMPPMRFFGQLFGDRPELAVQRAEDCGWVLGSELCEVGVDLNFAPVVDLDYGVSEVIGDRAFSRDPQVVQRLAGALLSGLHAAGIASCIKHFPGHGYVTADSHLELPRDERSREQFDADLEPFRRLAPRARSVMTAHLVAACEDSALVSFSSRWVRDILRRDLGFRGVVFSDDLSMKGADCEGGIHEKVTRAIGAGCEFLPICNDREAVLTLYREPPDLVGSARLAQLRCEHPATKDYRKTKRYSSFQEFISEQEWPSDEH